MDSRPLGAYARISDDRQDDTEGVGRQLRQMRARADLIGKSVVEYVDNDLSAFKRHVVRPRFEALLRDLDDGTLGGFLSPDLDRLWRQPVDLERAIEIFERNPGLVCITLSGDVNLSTSDGRMLARVMVAAANKSSADTARRVKWKHEDMRNAGKPAGGPRPFGYLPDRITPDPREAEAIRQAADTLTAGGTIAEVVRAWNAAGLTTTIGNPWKITSARKTLRNPRLKGVRGVWTKQGWAEALDASGKPIQAVWGGILDPDTFDAMRGALEARSKAYNAGGRVSHRYLLSGICKCGACGTPMQGKAPGGKRGNPAYQCPSAGMGGCGKVSRVAYRVDAIVVEAALGALAAHTQGATSKIVTIDRRIEIERLDALLADALIQWKMGNLPSADYFALRADLTADRKRLEAEQAEATNTAQRLRVAVDAPTRWGEASIAKRRAILDALLVAVVVHPLPVVNGRKVIKWNPELIEIVWRDA